MTPSASRTLGNIILVVAVILLLYTIASMLELIPKILPGSAMSLFVLVLVSLAGVLRRRGRQPGA